MTAYKIKIEKIGFWPWRWYWSVSEKGDLFSFDGIALTEKGARRAAEKAAKKLAVKPTPYTYTVEE